MDIPLRPELFDFHGVSMTHHYTDNWEKLQNFQARPDDVLIATYPRSGNTWLCCILDLLYFGERFPERQASIPIFRRVPLLEATFTCRAGPGGTPHVIRGTDMVEKLQTSPRLIKTHLPVQFIPKSIWEQNCRIVYSARNSKDNVVSYFHLERMTMIHPEPGDWSSYLQRFMEGKMLFGPWYKHVNGWWRKKQSPSNIHYVFYEDLGEVIYSFLWLVCACVCVTPASLLVHVASLKLCPSW
ncbi:cytosolic sulfotransferase 3-like isoform X1 [Acanthopagrus latus]|uniref:cytosolic sulfotransferase 3-like isoform X1 n=1 Tax=Acanthopagrus latus TaxID=8177 RepID=UPI00187C411C|nr:cytosolic sulfotransferase 3-like isoform X1 [Acanthopagrus latus]